MIEAMTLMGREFRRIFSPSLPLHPAIHFFLQDVERNGAVAEEFVEEGADAELIAQGFFCPLLQFLDFQLANFVGQGLSGPGNVTVYFCRNILKAPPRIGPEKINGLISLSSGNNPLLKKFFSFFHSPGRGNRNEGY
jgi:hypothetical protein